MSDRTAYDKIRSMNDLRKNQIHTAEIESWSSEGSGVCRIGGRAVFVPGTIPGERWELRIVKVTASAVYGKGEKLLVPSPSRIEPDCPLFGKCGGCDTRHLRYEAELDFKLKKVNDALTHIGRQSVPAREIIDCDSTDRTRNKAIFAVAETEDGPAFGFYRERSHTLIPIRDCLLQTELSCRCAAAVVEFLRRERLPAYDEASGKGTVRHVFCRQARQTGDAVLCVCSARGLGDKTGAFADFLQERCPELTGIVLNINKSSGNTVLAGDFYTLRGDPVLRDRLCGLEYAVSPRAFFQINPPQAEKLYERAAAYAAAGKDDLVFDLYCGAGTISLRLARDAGKVIGAEIVPEAVENAEENARRNGVGNAEFLCADAGEAAEALARRGLRPRVVSVDPPRKGMSPQAVEAVASMAPERIVYVSCDPATLARDLLRFQALGYELREVTAVDMFPRTCHVETVCLLYHQKKDFIFVPYEPKDAGYLKQNK